MTIPLLIIIACSSFVLLSLACWIIFPILALVDCVRNPNLNTPAKIAFGCLIVFTWALGACVYGIFGTRRPLYRTMAVLSVCLVVGSWLAIKPLKQYQQKLETQQAELQAKIQSSQAKRQADEKQVQELEEQTQELHARKIYFKLPLRQTKFHWRFLDRQSFLSNKLSLILKGHNRTEIIEVFGSGKISDGWGEIDEKRPGSNQIYFGFVSQHQFKISSLDEVEIQLRVQKDLKGIGPNSQGILKAGEYKSKCTVEIYSSALDTAYTGLGMNCTPMWDLIITDKKGWMDKN